MAVEKITWKHSDENVMIYYAILSNPELCSRHRTSTTGVNDVSKRLVAQFSTEYKADHPNSIFIPYILILSFPLILVFQVGLLQEINLSKRKVYLYSLFLSLKAICSNRTVVH
jgi:hypothetical protein